MPEVLALRLKYGDQLKSVMGAVENLRQRLGIDYNTLHQMIIDYLD